MGRIAAIAGAVALLGIGACHGGGGEGSEGCGPITREALDPNYLVHVLKDDASLQYRSDPPTSGPHQPGPNVHGAIDRTLTKPVQVGILEGGNVLLQYRPDDVHGDDLARLTALAGDRVVVTPNPDLPDPVVATAWLYKRTCDQMSAAPLQTFVDARVGHGPDQK